MHGPGGRRASDDGSRDVLVGIGYMFLAGIASSLMHIGVRTVSPHLPTAQITFLRAFFSLVFMLPFILAQGRIGWRSKRPGLHLARGLVSVVSIMAWYYALSVIPLADAAALSFTTAIFVTMGAALIFGERVGIRRWSAVAIGLVGTIVILRPGAGLISWGAMAALFGNVLWAASLLMVKELAKHDPPITISFLQPMLVAPLAGIAAAPVWVWPETATWLILVAMGFFGAIANFSYVNAMRKADASITMPVDFIRLVWMAGWGYVFFNEVPVSATWAGAALIIGSALYITWRESQLARARRAGPT
ncbi:MAG: DMT family transporter [Hyphomicrobiaceae bacterium]